MILFTPSSSYMIYLMINDVLHLIRVHLFLVMHLEIFRAKYGMSYLSSFQR